MTIKLNQQKSLPINRGLQPIYMTSSLIAIMMAVVSVVGLTNRTLIYSSEELVQGFLPNDIANLLIGLPILIGCMWAARRGKLAGLTERRREEPIRIDPMPEVPRAPVESQAPVVGR
ncbi:MAG: hypothetical protein P8Y72_11975, partial [Anaerolineales bacterium]